MKNRFDRRLILAHAAAAVLFLVVLPLLGALGVPLCPIRLIFDGGCPFCGMTRAHLAALRLDLRGAFAYHPLFPLGLPYLWLLFHEGLFRRKGPKIAHRVAVGVITAALLAVYFVKML